MNEGTRKEKYKDTKYLRWKRRKFTEQFLGAVGRPPGPKDKQYLPEEQKASEKSRRDSTVSSSSARTSRVPASNTKEVPFPTRKGEWLHEEVMLDEEEMIDEEKILDEEKMLNKEKNNESNDIEAENTETVTGSSHGDNDINTEDMTVDIADLNDIRPSQIMSGDDDEANDEGGNNSCDNDDSNNVKCRDGYEGSSDDEDDDDNDDDDDDEDGGGAGGGGGDSSSDDEDVRAFSIEQGPLMTFRPDVRENHFLWIMMAEATRFNLSIEAILGIIRAMKKLLNHNTLPVAKKTLWKRVGRKKETMQERHLYCKMCKGKVGIGKVPQEDCPCGITGPNKETSVVSFFIKIDVKKQLRRIFQSTNITQLLNYRDTRERINPEGIEDMTDGSCYKKLREENNFLNSQWNFSLTLNTDGCQVGKSSKQTAWPVLLMLNELPPHARKHFIIIAGIWVDDEQPSMEVYLEPIISELQDLYHTGFSWNPDGNGRVTSRFITTICSVDTPARSKLMNATSHNGVYGCTFCYATGTRMENGSRKFAMEVIVDRSDQEIRRHMDEAQRTGIRQMGLIGKSTLRYLPQFDLRLGVVVDSMHCVDIGVVKKLTDLIVFEPPPDIQQSTAKMVRIIDVRLSMIRTPSCISRKPKSIKLCNLWKASEWRNWLLYYSQVCLDGVIPEKYLTLFKLLSDAMHTLNSDSFTSEQLDIATALINDFVRKYEEFFGIEHMTMNMHLLLHLPRSARCWGPVWAHNCYAFESFNSRILKSLNSSTGRQVQIANRYLMTDFVRNISSDPLANGFTKVMVKEITNSAKKLQHRHNDGYADYFEFRGYGKSTVRNLLGSEVKILAKEGIRCRPSVTVFRKAVLKGTLYTSKQTEKENTRTCDKFIYTKKGEFAEIISIVTLVTITGEELNGYFVSWFENTGDEPRSGHLQSLRISRRGGFVRAQDVRLPAIMIKKKAMIFGIKIANPWETD